MNTLLLVLLAVFDQIIPEYKFSDGLTMIVYPVTCDEATTTRTIIATTTGRGGVANQSNNGIQMNVVTNSSNSGVEMNVMTKTTSTI